MIEHDACATSFDSKVNNLVKITREKLGGGKMSL